VGKDIAVRVSRLLKVAANRAGVAAKLLRMNPVQRVCPESERRQNLMMLAVLASHPLKTARGWGSLIPV